MGSIPTDSFYYKGSVGTDRLALDPSEGIGQGAELRNAFISVSPDTDCIHRRFPRADQPDHGPCAQKRYIGAARGMQPTVRRAEHSLTRRSRTHYDRPLTRSAGNASTVVCSR